MVRKLLKTSYGKRWRRQGVGVLLPLLLHSLPASALGTAELCRQSDVLALVVESVTDELVGIDAGGFVIKDVSHRPLVKLSDDALCHGMLIYSPKPQQQIELPIEFRVQEDIDNIYVTLLSVVL